MSDMKPTYEGNNGSPSPEPESNPVIDALKALQVFITSEAEKNPAKAEELKSAFMALVAALKGGEVAPEVSPSAPETSKPQVKQMGMGSRPMNQGASRTTPIM